MTEPLVLIQESGPEVTVLTLNRPEKRNALSAGLLSALCDGVAQVEADAARRVLVLRGAGTVFCAGLDLREAMDSDVAEQAAHLVARALRALTRSRLVTIAAVHGAAMAGGAGLMTACDLVVAAEDARIGYPEVHRGLVAGMVMALLCRQVGRRQAAELLLLGQPISARQALAIGLVNRVAPDDAVMGTAMGLAQQALLGAPLAMERTKRQIEELSLDDLDDGLNHALRQHLVVRDSPEAAEGLRAFVEKRHAPVAEARRDGG